MTNNDNWPWDVHTDDIATYIYIRTVQFNYNFTHAWYSMHGVPQVFACKIQKIAVYIIISTRRDVSLPETTHGICSKRFITRDVAVEVPISWGFIRISVGV